MTASPPTKPRPHRFTVDAYHRMIEAGLFVGDERVEADLSLTPDDILIVSED